MVNKINDCINDFSHLKVEPTTFDTQYSELFYAIEQGNLPEVRRLLALGIDINTINQTVLLQAALCHFNATNPLHAITTKAYSIIQSLLAAGLSCMQPVWTYLNIFDYAFAKNHFGLLVTLHEHYHPQIQISRDSLNDFFRWGHDILQLIEFIRKYYPKLEAQIIATMPPHGLWQDTWHKMYDTLLETSEQLDAPHPYLLLSSPTTAKKFLDRGVSPNIQDEAGFTALHHLSCEVGDMRCLPLLLSHGADLFLPAKDGSTPLSLACQRKHSWFLGTLQQTEASKKVLRPSLHTAILEGDLPGIEKNLESFDLEERDIFGNTAFQVAIRSCLLPAVKLLAPKCANKEALFFAAEYSSVEIVSFLITQVAVDEEMLNELFCEEEFIDSSNTQVVRWMIEHYALQYPKLFGDELISEDGQSVSFATLEACVKKMAQSQDLQNAIGTLLVRSVQDGQPQQTLFLLEYVQDHTVLHEDSIDIFYDNLFEKASAEVVEQVIKKLGVSSKVHLKDSSIVAFCKKYPHLFCQFSQKLFEDEFLRCKQNPTTYPIYNFYSSFYTLITLALCIGERPLIERVFKEFTIKSTDIYRCLCKIDISKVVFAEIIQLQREEDSLPQCEEVADMLLALQEFPAAWKCMVDAIEEISSFSDVQRIYNHLSKFAQKISLLSVVPCGHFSSKDTAEWLIDEIFSYYYFDNPDLFLDDAVVDTICDLLTRIRMPEEYSSLLDTLEEAPNKEVLASCLQKKEELLAFPITTPSVLRPRIIEGRDERGRTELFRAAEQGNCSEVKRLLSFGCNPKSRNAYGKSVLEATLDPLIEGRMASYIEASKLYTLIQLLAAGGADCHLPLYKSKYWNIFDCAFSLQNYGLLFALHRYYKPGLMVRGEALQNFFFSCEAEDLEFIAKYYPTLELRAGNYSNICHALISRKRLDLLIKYKELAPHKFTEYVQETGVNSLLYAVLHMPEGEEKWEFVSFLRKSGATFDKIPSLVWISPEITTKLLAEGMNCNEQDEFGFSALHQLASAHNIKPDFLPLLLQRGADPFLPSSIGSTTPIMIATMSKNSRFLATVSISDAGKQVPRPALHTAILTNTLQPGLVQASDLEIKDCFGHTALQTAILHKSLPAVQLLSGSVSKEILIFAAEYSSIEVVSFLISQAELDLDTILKMFSASKRANSQVTRWIVERFAIQYPESLGCQLVQIGSFTAIQEYVQEVKKSSKSHLIGSLFVGAILAKQPSVASFLLDQMDTTSYAGAYNRIFELVEHCETAFLAKLFKKFGINCRTLFLRPLIETFCKKHPTLVNQSSPALFEKGFSLCKEDRGFLEGVMIFAIYRGDRECVDRLFCAFGPSQEQLRDFLKIAIKADRQEAVAYFAEKIAYLSDYQKPLPDSELALSLQHGNKASIQTLMKAYEKQKLAPDFQKIYEHFLLFCSPKESLKTMLIQTTKLVRCDLTQLEVEEMASFMMPLAKFPAAVFALASSSKETYKRLAKCLEKLPNQCLVPWNNFSLHYTCNWLIEQIFIHSKQLNPKLFSEATLCDTILQLLPLVTRNEEYGSLLVALQAAPHVEALVLAFQAAKRLEETKAVKPSKEVFISKSVEEQKEWLSFACVYRDRTFIPHCYYIIKHHGRYPTLLLDALHAVDQIGVGRYDSTLENTLATVLKTVLETSQNENVKILALKAYVNIAQSSLDFLLKQLEEARSLQRKDYEVAVCRHLGKDYEWTSSEEGEKAVQALLIGLKSAHVEVRFQTALAITSIPHRTGLLAALDVVQGPTWDRMLPHFGKNKKDIVGPPLAIRSRLEEIHDNRSAVVQRISLQLAHLDENDSQLQEIDFQSIAQCTRYVSKPIAYPPKADLIRGISTRKGIAKFREAVRDLLRKGAGSSELTDYDSSVCCNTWNKIGHMFASHSKELFFSKEGTSPYFSENSQRVVSESALIIFPALYYQKEHLAGEARLEREGPFNNVLYRGIPHRWIKAVYLPVRFKHDIELLTSDTPLKTLAKDFTSDLFKGDSIKELDAFRRLLLAREPSAFAEKIRYFPEVNRQEIEKILIQDGIQFVTEEEIKQETTKLAAKLKCFDDNPLFWTQDRFLAKATDAEFKAHAERFFAMLPGSLGSVNKKRVLALNTDTREKERALLRVAALFSGVEPTQVQEILRQNPCFYGLEADDIALVQKTLESVE